MAERLTSETLLEQCAGQAPLTTSVQEPYEPRIGNPYMSNTAYEYFTNLQYKVKSLSAQVGEFKSGEKYVKMQEDRKAQLAIKDREIKKLKRELADARCQVVTVRKIWEGTVEDLEKEHAKAMQKKDREIEALKKKLLETQVMLDVEKDKCRDMLKVLYQVRTELEEEQGKVLKLKAQINRDYENSSKPSSQKPNHKKIENNREVTGRRVGGQPGHEHHPRKRHAPTETIAIPAPEEYLNNPRYRATGKMIAKQVVNIRIGLDVIEYSTPEFRHIPTGQFVHAGFPEGLVDDVNYGGSVKAFAFLLNNRCNVSIKNVSGFLSELTGGELNISAGMINGLSKAFSMKTQREQRKAFADIQLSPVMNTDFTSARVNGRNVNVIVCATPDIVLYFAREHKGHEGVKGTPVENYLNTMVHDHDKTFYHYGGAHQECLDHPSRYLKGSMENEPGLKWNVQMRELLREMIHFRNSLDTEDGRDPDQIDPGGVAQFEARYDEILALAKEEYECEPPSKYYVDGFNLYRKLLNYKKEHLLFLHDRRVPHNNNLSERLLRVFKRKSAQMMTFRSDGGLDYLCQSLGTVASLRAQGENLYESVSSIFCRATDIPLVDHSIFVS
ncbi:MAG: transposase [Clostridiales bacterium]|nr:transposase [Clostridiales bacterium]